jgi:cytoskeletal protein CcmA (bactofilin family)
MASPAPPASPEPVVGPGARFEGTLAFRGEARVEGEVEGAVLARGTLHVAPGARVCARIEADELVVAGTVEGDVLARRRVALLAGARLVGDVRTGRLALADGSVLQGRCEMLTGLSPSESAP